VWQISTLNVSVQGASSQITTAYGNHYANGFTHQANDPSSGGGYTGQQSVTRPFSNLSSVTNLAGTLPASGNLFGHLSWANDNASDTNPVFMGAFTGSFAPVNAWDNEIIAYATNGTGKVWRFAHNYSTNNNSYDFSAGQAIGSVSQDGKWFAWTSDWDGMLGKTDNVTTACSIGTNCRGDVFMMALPLNPGTGSTVPAGVKIVGATVQ
jgi:hypothetical protein